MSARALLNHAEAHLLHGLGEEQRVQVRWQISDPTGYYRHQRGEVADELLLAGGEIG